MIIVISTGEALSAGGDFGIGGWTPVLGLVADGNRIVQQVVDFTGGSGIKPDTGLYVGTAGFVSLIADAVNVRGATGAGTAGLNAWTAVEAIAVDGERRVKQVIDWVGGTGDKPQTGMYVGPAGYVALASQATDVRGAAGATPQDTDALAEGANNKFFTTGRVLSAVLNGISFASGVAVSAADTIVVAIGKLQKQLSDVVVGNDPSSKVAASISSSEKYVDVTEKIYVTQDATATTAALRLKYQSDTRSELIIRNPPTNSVTIRIGLKDSDNVLDANGSFATAFTILPGRQRRLTFDRRQVFIKQDQAGLIADQFVIVTERQAL